MTGTQNKDIDNIYKDGQYFSNHPTWHQEDSPWKAKQIIKILEKNNVNPSSISEVGCGAGEILNCLSDALGQEVRLNGYEISPQAYELCKPKENGRLTFHMCDFTAVETTPADVLLVMDVFEHVPDYMGFLEKIRSKARYKIFHIPLDLSAQTVLRSKTIINRRKNLGHLHYFTKDTALATLEDCGYNIIDHFYTACALDLPSKSIKSFLARIPRRILFKLSKTLTVRLLGGYSLLVLTE